MRKLIALLLGIVLCIDLYAQKPAQPNIVLIFMDDMAYGDLGVNGALGFTTPHMDKLAAEGVRFTNFVSAQAVCSASRAGLLTGCYPNRLGISGAYYPTDKAGIHADEVTIAEMLKQKGYATAAIGKWHLGHHRPFLPLQHGFDEYYGIPYSNDMWPVGYDGLPAKADFKRYGLPVLPLIRGNETVEEIKDLDQQGELTGKYTREAVAFIRRNARRPFFLYLAHSMPHVPINASPAFRGKSEQGLFGDMMMELDWSVGEVMKALKEQGLEKNTLVILTSDNGPWIAYGDHAGSTGGFREGKGTAFEGGVRVPCIVKWKGKFPEGRVCNKLSSTIDILPTIASITGTRLPDRKIDGVDITALMEGKEVNPRKTFYYYYDRNSLKAVRMGDWKLMLPHRSQTYERSVPVNGGYPMPTYNDLEVPLALYDLRRDPGERHNVKDVYPQIVEQLLKIAEEARTDLGDDIMKVQGRNVRPVGQLSASSAK